MLRTSERGAMKMCEFFWDLTYNQELKPLSDMPALRFGGLVHKALAAWYVPGVKRGQHPARAFERYYAEDLAVNEEVFGMRVGEDEKWINALELGVAMLENYIDEYGQDDRYEVLVTEHPFETVVYNDQGKPWFLYVGVLDGVWRDRRDRTIWIPDHKTTAGIGGTVEYPKFPAHLLIDDQAGSYWSWGVQALRESKLLKPNQQVNGMLYNFLRKTLPDERPSKLIKGRRLYLNKDGTLSKRQPSPYFARFPVFRDEYDREEQKRRSIVDFKRINMFRNGELEMTKSPGMFTCPMCSMRDVCELHETGNDWMSFLKAATQPWEPYAEHEVYQGR
jgi:hypothetical protein